MRRVPSFLPLLLAASFAGAAAPSLLGGDPQGQSLFVMPTAFTPPQGAVSARVVSFALPTLTVSPFSTTSITAGALLPFPNKIFFAGFKQRILAFNDGRAAISATGTVLKPTGDSVGGGDILWGGAGLAGFRVPASGFSDGFGLHGMLGYYRSTETETNEHVYPNRREEVRYDYVTWGVGMELRTAERFKLLFEYDYGDPRNPGENGGGGFTPGLRYHRTNFSFDAGLFITSVKENNDKTTYLIPVLTFGYRF